MFIQILGALMVLASSTLIGTYFGSAHGYRAKDLLQLRKALVILKGEIEYTLTPLSQACANVAERVLSPIAEIFLDLSYLLNERVPPEQAMYSAIAKHKTNTYLSKDDIAQLQSLAKTLGYLDKNLQTNTLELTIKYLDDNIKEQMDLHIKNKKLYQTLGVLGGMLVIIVLL